MRLVVRTGISLGLLGGLALALASCGDRSPADRQTSADVTPVPSSAPARSAPAPWPRVARFEPDPAEPYANGKRLAGRIALRALTYPHGASATAVARRITSSSAARRRLARVLEPAVDPKMRSRGEVVYPQLSGVTSTSLGAMVVVRQRLEDAGGERRTITRVLDVRLRRSGGPWSLDRIASVGGRPIARPAGLSAEAKAVLDSPRITLSDSARWDIRAGDVDNALLGALSRLSKRHRFSVGILRSGHPTRVWDTVRVSAHSRGLAADIYAVDGQLVLRQRDVGSPAHSLASSLVARGAEQVGSPWQLAAGSRGSFTDAVHQDHVHVQWSPLP
jgi:hypothetical protein